MTASPSSAESSPGTGRPQVLVLGGGFGGIGAARKLHGDVEADPAFTHERPGRISVRTDS